MVARDDDRTPCATEKAVLRKKKPRKAQRRNSPIEEKHREKLEPKQAREQVHDTPRMNLRC
jgi:hypothetical protein